MATPGQGGGMSGVIAYGIDTNGEPRALKLDPSGVLSTTAGGGGGSGDGAILDGVNPLVKATVTAANALKVDGSAVTQPISAASLPLPTGAAADTTVAAVRDRLPSALVGGRLDVNLGASGITLPVSGPLTDAQLRASAVPVSGTFWQATQPVSAASLPLPTGASTETTLAAMSAKLPATLGQKTMANSLAVVLASDQSAIPVLINPVANMLLTYDVGARGIVSGALVAGTPKAIMSFEHAATATKTVRIRRIMVHMIQTTALAGAIDVQITRGTAASSAGAAVTPTPRKSGDAAAEVTVKTLPTITAATVVDNIPAGGFSATTVLYSPPVLVYDWQEGANSKPLELTAGALQSIVISVVSTAAHNLTLTVSVDFTEE